MAALRRTILFDSLQRWAGMPCMWSRAGYGRHYDLQAAVLQKGASGGLMVLNESNATTQNFLLMHISNAQKQDSAAWSSLTTDPNFQASFGKRLRDIEKLAANVIYGSSLT